MEEPSFRGFAQPELQAHRSPMAATAIMAVLVTGWHLPLFFMPVFNAHPIGIVTTVAVTFWYAWLFNHASGSSLLTLIAHGAYPKLAVQAMQRIICEIEQHPIPQFRDTRRQPQVVVMQRFPAGHHDRHQRARLLPVGHR